MRPARIFVSLFFALAAVSYAAAQTPAASPSAVIGEIHAAGSQRFTQAQVAAASGLKPGDKVTREQLQQIADRLAQTGVFTKVNYSFTTRDDKIAVEFQLQDAPAVPALFDNFPWFTDAELAATIRETEPLFDGASAPEDGTMLDEMTAALTKLLAAHNLAGRVAHELTAHPFSDGMLMQFRVEDSNIAVAAVEYGDVLAQASEKLSMRNADLVGKPFSRFAIDVFENEQVLPVYLAAGHIRTQFGKPQVRLAGNPAQATVALPIIPGPIFHLAEIAWSGPTALKEPELLTLLPLKSGDLADGGKIEAGWQRIQREYAHRGYLDVQVDARPQFDDAAEMVSYRVAIAEGPQYHMGSLVITGLSVDSERALRTYWHLAPGAIFDGTYSDTVQMKLERPSGEVFGNIPLHYTQFGHWLRTNPDQRTVDVLFDFK